MLYSKELKWASNLNRKINLLDLIFFCLFWRCCCLFGVKRNITGRLFTWWFTPVNLSTEKTDTKGSVWVEASLNYRVNLTLNTLSESMNQEYHIYFTKHKVFRLKNFTVVSLYLCIQFKLLSWAKKINHMCTINFPQTTQ